MIHRLIEAASKFECVKRLRRCGRFDAMLSDFRCPRAGKFRKIVVRPVETDFVINYWAGLWKIRFSTGQIWFPWIYGCIRYAVAQPASRYCIAGKVVPRTENSAKIVRIGALLAPKHVKPLPNKLNLVHVRTLTGRVSEYNNKGVLHHGYPGILAIVAVENELLFSQTRESKITLIRIYA